MRSCTLGDYLGVDLSTHLAKIQCRRHFSCISLRQFTNWFILACTRCAPVSNGMCHAGLQSKDTQIWCLVLRSCHDITFIWHPTNYWSWKRRKNPYRETKKNFRYLLTLVFHVFSDFLAKQIYNHTSSESSFLAGELVLRVVTLVTVAILP